MNEDDIIDRVERIADFGWSDYDDFSTNQKAVQGILDLYNKQKQQIKSLKQENAFLKQIYSSTEEFKRIERLANNE